MNSENLLAIDYAKFRSRPHDAVIRVYRDTGNVIETKSSPDARGLQKLSNPQRWGLISMTITANRHETVGGATVPPLLPRHCETSRHRHRSKAVVLPPLPRHRQPHPPDSNPRDRHRATPAHPHFCHSTGRA